MNYQVTWVMNVEGRITWKKKLRKRFIGEYYNYDARHRNWKIQYVLKEKSKQIQIPCVTHYSSMDQDVIKINA